MLAYADRGPKKTDGAPKDSVGCHGGGMMRGQSQRRVANGSFGTGAQSNGPEQEESKTYVTCRPAAHCLQEDWLWGGDHR